MNENIETPNYYAILPAFIRYDKRLKFAERLMYGEITSLCNKSGECWAKNSYFADLYDVSVRTISSWINHLKELGYINIKIEQKEFSKEIDKRIITINNLPTVIVENKQEPKVNNDENNLIENFDKIWNIYPRKDGKNIAYKHYKAWLKGKKYLGSICSLSNKEMWFATQIYNLQIKELKTEKQYIKMGSTFFNETIYEYVEKYRKSANYWENKIREEL